MRRREFITLLDGAAAWPLAARAQQGERMRRIGVLMSLRANDQQGQARLAAFVQGLRELGWIDGRNVRIDTRWGAGNANDARKYAAEIVALAPDVIIASGGVVATTLIQTTRTVPIVFTQTVDPVGGGLVASLARGRAATLPVFLRWSSATQQRHHVLLSLVPRASERSSWPFNAAAAASQARAAARPAAYLS
jgi:hypothetical protein